MERIVKFFAVFMFVFLGAFTSVSASAETRVEYISKPPHQVSWLNYDGCTWQQVAGWGYPGQNGISTVGGYYRPTSSCSWSGMRVTATGRYTSGWDWRYEIVLE